MGAVQVLLPHPERTRISDAPYPEGTLLTKIKKFKYLDRKNTWNIAKTDAKTD